MFDPIDLIIGFITTIFVRIFFYGDLPLTVLLMILASTAMFHAIRIVFHGWASYLLAEWALMKLHKKGSEMYGPTKGVDYGDYDAV